MVVIDEATFSVEYKCAVCGDVMDPADPGVVVVRFPERQGHAMCADDWHVLIVSAWAFLYGAADEDQLARNGRVRAAYAAFTKENE